MTLRESRIALVAMDSIQPMPERLLSEPIASAIRSRERITDEEIARFFRTADGMRAKGQLALALMLRAEAKKLLCRLSEPLRRRHSEVISDA